jgi:hypothetical protein
MNINSIFNLFDNYQSSENDETSLLIDFSEHPLFWIGGFNKVINNHNFFKQYTVKMFKNISPDLNIDEVEKAGEHLMFEKAWGYIKGLNVENSLHVDCIKSKSSKEFISNLELVLLFFEKSEEYEKCAVIKKIKNKVEEFLL